MGLHVWQRTTTLHRNPRSVQYETTLHKRVDLTCFKARDQTSLVNHVMKIMSSRFIIWTSICVRSLCLETLWIWVANCKQDCYVPRKATEGIAHRFFPDINIILTSGAPYCNEIIILRGYGLWIGSQSWLYGMGKHTSTVWISWAWAPCLRTCNGSISAVAKMYTFPWSLPQTTTLPFSPNTPLFTNFLLDLILKEREGELWFAE